jgi:hypothetical protein
MMTIKNTFRTLFNIRVERALPPPGPQPTVGSSIVRGTLRIRLKVPIDSEQWAWFSGLGWRTTDMRADRRRYLCVEDKALLKLLDADNEKRDRMHAQLLLWEENKGMNGQRKTMRPARKASANVQDRAHRRI